MRTAIDEKLTPGTEINLCINIWDKITEAISDSQMEDADDAHRLQRYQARGTDAVCGTNFHTARIGFDRIVGAIDQPDRL